MRILPISLLLCARLAQAQGVPPEQVSGIATPDEQDDHSTARAGLTPVRWLTEAIVAPFRGAAYLFDVWQIPDHIKTWFFNDAGTFGIYPTAFVESQLGWNVGLHLVETDLTGHEDKIQLSASYGGEFQQAYVGKYDSGKLLGPLEIKARASYQAWNKSNFFGIGNGDLQPLQYGTYDPYNAMSPAVHTRFGQHVELGELDAVLKLGGPLTVTASGAYERRTFNEHPIADEYTRIEEVYDVNQLVGFNTGANNFYGELALTVDERDYASRYIPRSTPSSGWYATIFGGLARGVEDDPSHYTRYGVDARTFIDLFGGDRVLTVRGYAEGVTADITQIPFSDLVRLGGNDLLRGFERDRFRDRTGGMVSFEYSWPIQLGLGAYVFTDLGEVQHTWNDFTWSGIHPGYGAGLEIHTPKAFVARLQVMASSDGVLFRLAVDPLDDPRARARKL